MRVVKQLSDDMFIVRMEKEDLSVNSGGEKDSFFVAHDYVQINTHASIGVEGGNERLTGPYTFGHNYLHFYVGVQITIRKFIQVMLPYFIKHKYCQLKHLFYKDGTPAYAYYYYHDVIKYWPEDADVNLNAVPMVACINKKTGEVIHMPEEEYDALTEEQLDERFNKKED